MVLYLLLGALAVVLLATILLPTWRRIWVFHLFVAKHFFLWFASLFSKRRLPMPVIVRRFCEDMGPTFIKFGQIVASSSGLFPKRYTEEFQKCLDRVRPFPFVEVQAILAAELGDKAARLVDIDPKPLASASIAQVHIAKLDGKVDVVLKVQRPNIDRRIDADMKIMRVVARLLLRFVRDAELANPVGIVDDFADTLREELDFRKEGANLDRFNEIMAELGHKNVRAPRPEWAGMTTRKVLVMERFFGTRVDAAEEIRQRGVDAEGKLIAGLRAWFQCVLFYGFFHGDVHAGNLMLLADEDLGFLDFGIVGRFDTRQKAMVTDYIVAFATGNFKQLAQVIVDMGGVKSGVNMEALTKDLEGAYSPIIKLSFGDINYADLLPQINAVATKHRMKMPKEFVLITKQMLYFDRYAKLLAPNLNIFTDPRLVMSLMADVQKAKAAQTAAAAQA